MVSSGDFAERSCERASAMSLYTLSSCCAKPLVVSTRFGMRSLRRCSWFSTCAHCVLIASSSLTNRLYEQPVEGSAASTATRTPTPRALLRVMVITVSIVMLNARIHQLAPPPPPPLRPPPNPPKPPPNPPPPPELQPPPNGPTPLDQPLHGPPPQ